jgi:DnaJ-class molecular chaperone
MRYNAMTMCSSCSGDGKCEFCEGHGVVITPHDEGCVTMYETQPCAVCLGSGKCPSCAPAAGVSLIGQPLKLVMKA